MYAAIDARSVKSRDDGTNKLETRPSCSSEPPITSNKNEADVKDTDMRSAFKILSAISTRPQSMSVRTTVGTTRITKTIWAFKLIIN